MRIAKLFLCFAPLSMAGCGGDTGEASTAAPGLPVIVYAARDAASIQSVLNEYTRNTGVNVGLTTNSGRALIDRLVAEKHTSTADLVLTDGIGYLWSATENDILRPGNSDLLNVRIPENLRDPDNFWVALLVVARTIVYDKSSIDPDDLSSYAALGDERWRERLCLTSKSLSRNQSHVAMMIMEHGDRPAELIIRSWTANLAIPMLADDAELLRVIDDGRCSLGIVNSDVAARHVRDNPDTKVARHLPTASDGGSYINIVGAAVTRHAGNAEGALQLLEWLSSVNGQAALAGESLEYRLDEYVPADQNSSISLAGAGYYLEDAVKLMERAHWDR